jgi:hypothetical protein
MSDSNDPIRSADESHERTLNRHRGDEQRRAAAEAADRLAGRGITVNGDEDPETLVDLLDAVESFERNVEARGGDLMVDTPPSTQPDNPRFVIPPRRADESLRAYTARIRDAASGMGR